ncbi:hypothetical protein C8Q74DRAFT_1242007 [Fomes fomentarius]|nr:hypothetical protein C8Q74DRAFT_1242007 [Fomes fomentarius]
MRAGFFAALFLSATAVFAAPSPQPTPAPAPNVQQRDIVDNLESVAANIFSVTIDLKSILSVATPVVASVIAEATSVVGEFLQSDTALAAEATKLVSQAESALGPAGTQIANELNNVVSTPNGAVSGQDLAAVRPLSVGAAAVVGSLLLGAFAAL